MKKVFTIILIVSVISLALLLKSIAIVGSPMKVFNPEPFTTENFSNVRKLDNETARVLDLYGKLNQSEKRIYSQNYEDGVILKLIELISGFIALNKTFVEFGTEDASQCTSERNWAGEGSCSTAEIAIPVSIFTKK